MNHKTSLLKVLTYDLVDGKKRTQKKEKRLDLFSKKIGNHRSGIYTVAKSSLCLIQQVLNNTNKIGVLLFNELPN
ncbi:Uncharacterized protein FWK35_00034205 [Aphis craccivora]|uniref:Uncharacterized protein n=1 Tax=Aphis craccivora TaxID=307492 RepID=A0A6G0XYL2_APHCR|nr:Uncharacterized protein FWK35_00034205 [Aphis craccivora]